MGSLVTPFGNFRKDILATMTNQKDNKQTATTKVELPEIDSFQLRMVQTYKSNKVISPTHFKLKNEWVFAGYALSVSALRLLYFSIAHFDDDMFYADEKVNRIKQKSHISKEVHWEIYRERDSRTILIPATVLMKVIRGNRSKNKSNNYKQLNDAILELNSAELTLNSKKNGKMESETIKIFDHVEMFRLEKFEVSKKIYIRMIFSTKFMPLLIACAGYTTVPFDTMINLGSSYAMRYYHWCLYGLKKKGVSGRFSVSISEIRKRFKIGDDEFRHHFDSRCIQKPIDDVMARTDLEIYIEELQRASKTKRRAKLEVATFNVAQLPEGISSS